MKTTHQSLAGLYEKLAVTRSQTVQDNLIECYLSSPQQLVESEEALLKLAETSDVDERQLIFMEYLGREEEAAALRLWLEKKKKKTAESSTYTETTGEADDE